MYLRKFAANGYIPYITQQNICMNIMHNKMEKFITQLFVTRHTENDVTQRSIQISANQPA